MSGIPLSDELLVGLARTELAERDRARLRGLIAAGPDWERLFRAASGNRVAPLVFCALDGLAALGSVPERIRLGLEKIYEQTVINTRVYLDEAAGLAADLAGAGIDCVLLRGLAVGITVYPKPYLRPFSDLDLLVPAGAVSAALARLRARGYESLPDSCPDRYFLRHHLHVPLRHGMRETAVELHWALDHRYTLHTIAYSGVFRRATQASFSGLTVPVLGSDDRILALSLHLAKHCPFLAALREAPDAVSSVLGARLLVWLADIHEWVRNNGAEADWPALFSTALRWGIVDALADALAVMSRLYGSELPAACQAQVSAHARKGPGPLARWTCRLQANAQTGVGRRGALARWLLGLQHAAVFRPVRCLELVRYLVPPVSYLRRRYGSRNLLVSVAVLPIHTVRGMLRFGWNVMDYLWCRLVGGGRRSASRCPRSPWLGAVLACVVPGLGRLYAGYPVRALLVALAYCACAGALLLSRLSLFATAAGFVTLRVLVCVGAVRLARRGRGVRLYQRWYALLALGVGATLVLQALQRLAVQPVVVVGDSMLPTLEHGDMVLTDGVCYRFRTANPGEIVVLANPLHAGRLLVKRAVAVGGQRVEVKGHHVTVDGVVIRAGGEGNGPRGRTVDVPPGHVYVLSDNMKRMPDSRYFGPVPESSVRQRVVRVYWSWDAKRGRARWQRVGRVVDSE